MVEIEVKIRIEDPRAVRDKLLSLGASVRRPRHLEENIYYEGPAGDFGRRDFVLRVRRAGKRSQLTFKGPARKSRSFKVREEYETDVKKPGQLGKILKALGCRQAFTYRKYRTLFRKSRLTICLDETAAGNYIELEGERHEIVKLAKALGYTRKDFITKSYPEMIGESLEAGQ